MAIPSRNQDRGAPLGGTFFVTSATWERRPLFSNSRMAEMFIETLRVDRAQGRYALHEFTLMPEHFHVLITPSGISIQRAVQFIKGGFSHHVGKEIAPKLEVWQRGFSDHQIRDVADYLEHKKYIWANAMKRGLAVEASLYPYCSAHPGFELDPAPDFAG